jgi:restriction system protein
LPTNKTLSKLLAAHLGLQLEETFATNLFPYVKPGNMKTPIPHDLLFASARRFAIPQIEVVKPSLVICLGLDTFNALSDALEQRTFGRIANAIESRIKLPTGQQIWCQAHTGKLGQMTRNRKGPGTVDQDWRAMTEDYRQSR